MNELKPFQMGPNDNSWKTSTFRQNVVAKIEEAIQQSGMQVARNSNEMENHVFMKAKTKDEYMSMVAKLILHVREMSGQQKASQVAPNMQGPTQNQMAANQQVQNQAAQAQQGPGSSQTGLAPDPINALQNLASQGSRNQMMNMGGPQGQMQQQNVLGQNPGMPGMQAQMGQQGPIVSQSGPQGTQTASNLLQTLTQRPQLNMQMQGKLGPMGMVPNQNQMGNNMVAGMGGMGNPMAGQLQNQLGGPGMQGQMMPNMSMQNSMPMSVANSMVGQMQCNQVVGGMTGQLPTTMQSQMPGQMVGMTGNQMGINMLQHIQNRTQGKPDVSGMLTAGYGARGPQPSNFFRQSPSPSAPSPNMGGPSPVSMGVMGNAMSSPMSLSNLGCAGGVGVGSPAHAASPSAPHLTHHPQQMAPQQRGVGMSMVASPSSSLNTPVGAGGGGGGGAGTGGASPGGEEAAYREKVRQLSKYIEPLRRMVHRMVSEGENVEKLTKMKNLLDILSNPNKRMPLETLIKCEVVLEKLDFKRSESVGLGPQIPGSGKEQIFNPLLEVVNNCLQSPLANHTLKRTFASTLDALNGPEIKNLPPPHKVAKSEETASEIPDILQGEIARLDSRFKVSLETMQLCNGGEGGAGGGAISLIAQLDDARLPCVPPVHVSVPRDYPARAPAARLRPRGARAEPPDSFLARVEKAMEARCARLPKSCSLGQLLDAWEMSVRQACTPHANYTPVPALGI